MERQILFATVLDRLSRTNIKLSPDIHYKSSQMPNEIKLSKLTTDILPYL